MHPISMLGLARVLTVLSLSATSLLADDPVSPPARDPNQDLERTCFQTSQPWSGLGNLGSDVAITYGIGPNLPDRIKTWREHGYRIHVMTGVAWGQYQDYLAGRFDGVNHEDEEQTDRNGRPHGHGGGMYYMCPGTNYGSYLCVGVGRALEAGAEAIHLEEPEFWVRDGYEEGFKREWKNYYNEDWQPPHGSVDAQWRASKLKYFLYRRALQQVFDFVQDFNKRTGRYARCYVPTHSLLNYAHWHIVSPESSLARLNGCDGYIAQVWTGTSRTPNVYRGQLRERTFETAFLEYGAMRNLVRSTGRTVWYLNDPIEDNPDYDWNDYQRNWESTLVASLFQPEVWRYEVAPWPERIFGRRYPRRGNPELRKAIPPAYATELQTVFNALNDMNQRRVEWDCGSGGVGVLVGDSLMFERGDPKPSDEHLSHIYGMALPLVKRGIPVAPVQLENVTAPNYLDSFRILLLTYQGMKPLTPDVHASIADWVRAGGALVVCDDDTDGFNQVREWWNTGVFHYSTPREHLFEKLGLKADSAHPIKPGTVISVGKGSLCWLQDNPARYAANAQDETRMIEALKQAARKCSLKWRESNYLSLRRGPYVIAAGLDESIAGGAKELKGKFVNLFDAELRVQDKIQLSPGARFFLLDLEAVREHPQTVLASACKVIVGKGDKKTLPVVVEGIADTPAIILMRASQPPHSVTLGGKAIESFEYVAGEKLLWIRFPNEARQRELLVTF